MNDDALHALTTPGQWIDRATTGPQTIVPPRLTSLPREWAERHYRGWGIPVTLYLWRELVEERGARPAD